MPPAAASSTAHHGAGGGIGAGAEGRGDDGLESASKSRVDFSALPISQLDTYISYYELAPAFPPALDPAPPPLLLSEGSGSGRGSVSSGEMGASPPRDAEGESSVREGAGAKDHDQGADGGGADAAARQDASMEKSKQDGSADADPSSTTSSSAPTSRKRKAAAEADDALPLSTLLSVGRRAAAAAASTKMRGDIQDPYGDHAAAAAGAETGFPSSGAAQAQQEQHRGASPSGGGGAARGNGPDSFFDGEAANTYLSSVAGAHFARLPQPKEGEIVVGFLYKCKTRDKILKIA